MRYRAFISYKHVVSTSFAERLELALKSYAKPLWQPPVSIFRDEKYLRPGPDLPRMIAEALEDSEFLIYLASPQAAASSWVQDELSQWCAQPDRLKNLIIVLTAGEIAFHASSKLIDWDKTNALPGNLRSLLKKVPHYLDCSRLVEAERQSLLDPDFKKIVNVIVATFRNLDPIQMSGQEIFQYRRNVRNRNLLLSALLILMLLAAIGAELAARKSREAAAQARVSKAAQLASEAAAAAVAQLPQRALLLAAAAAGETDREGEGITQQSEQTMRDLLAVTGGYGLAGHTSAISNVQFLPDGRLLSIGQNGEALLWNVGSDRQVHSFAKLLTNKGRVLAAQILWQMSVLRFITETGHVAVRGLRAGIPEFDFDLAHFEVSHSDESEPCATKITESEVLQVSGRDHTLRTWSLDAAMNSAPSTARQLDATIEDCHFSQNGQWLYVASGAKPPVLLATSASIRPTQVMLDGVSGQIVYVAFSENSRTLAVAMDSGRVSFWRLDVQQAEWRHAFDLKAAGQGQLVMSAFGPRTDVFATAAKDGTIRVWQLSRELPKPIGATKVPFEMYREMAGEMSFKRDDTLLLVSDGLRAGAAIAISANGGVLQMTPLHNHPKPTDVAGDRATPYAVHPRQPILATAGDDNNIVVWTMQGNLLRRRDEPLRGHDGAVISLTFSPDGNWLATGGYDKTIRLWPVQPAQWTAAPAVLGADDSDVLVNDPVPNPEGGVQLTHFIGGEEWLESIYEDSEFRLASIGDNGRLRQSVRASADGDLIHVDPLQANLLRSASADPRLQRRVVADFHKQTQLSAPEPNSYIRAEQNRSALAEAETDGTIRLWNLPGQHPTSTVFRGFSGPIVALAASIGSGAIAAVNDSGQLAVWRISAPGVPQFIGQLHNLLSSAKPLATSIPSAATLPLDDDFPPQIDFLSAEPWLIVDHRYLVDLRGKTPVPWKLPAGAHEVANVAACCVMQLFDEHFAFWIIGEESGRPVEVDPGSQLPGVTSYDYNPHARRLALGTLDGRVVVMDFNQTGQAIRRDNVASHDFGVRAVALNSNARVLAAGSRSGVTLTELRDDLSVARHIRLNGHRGEVRLLHFSSGDKWLLSGGEDNTVHVHPVSVRTVLQLTCVVAGRPLSALEKERLGQQAPDPCQSHQLQSHHAPLP